ncbi:MULE domain-containing protein, partial [Aphis craccivora]
KCATFNLYFSLKTVVADFEQAFHFDVKKVWPSITLVGCRFHLTQAWWKNIQRCRLQTEYKNIDSEIGKWLYLIFGLSHFPHYEVEDVFINELMTILPTHSNVTKFTDYIVENYISSTSTLYPIFSERTTNACESFHASFSSNFYSSHPNIFVFLKAIIETQTNTYIAINSTEEDK